MRPKTSDAKELAFKFKKDLILDVACEQFYEKGYNNTKIDDIADALKVTKPFIYYHFENKIDILGQVCSRTTLFAVELAETAAKGVSSSPAERMRTLVREFALRVIAERKYMSVYFRDAQYLPASMQAHFRKDRRRFHRALSKLLTEGRECGDFDFQDLSIVGQTLTGMATWIFNWYRPEGRRSPEETAEVLVDLVMAMLRTRSA